MAPAAARDPGGDGLAASPRTRTDTTEERARTAAMPLPLRILLPAAVLLPAALAAEPADLRFRPEAGTSYRQLLTSEDNVAMRYGNRTETSLGSTTFGLRTEILAAAEDGSRTARVTFERVAASSTRFRQKAAFDTGDPAMPPQDEGARAFARLVGQSFTVTFGPDGDPAKVEGMAAVIANVTEDIADPQLREVAAASLAIQIGDAPMQEFLRRALRVNPAHPVAEDATWSARWTQGGVAPADVATSTTLTSHDGTRAVFAHVIALTPGRRTEEDRKAIGVWSERTGVLRGPVEVRAADGVIVRAELAGETRGTQFIDDGPETLPPAEFPEATTMKIRVELLPAAP